MEHPFLFDRARWLRCLVCSRKRIHLAFVLALLFVLRYRVSRPSNRLPIILQSSSNRPTARALSLFLGSISLSLSLSLALSHSCSLSLSLSRALSLPLSLALVRARSLPPLPLPPSLFIFRGRSELLPLFMLTYTSHYTRRRAFTLGLPLVTRKFRKIRLVVACLVGQGARPPAAPKPGPVVLSRTPLDALVVDESSISPRTHSYN